MSTSVRFRPKVDTYSRQQSVAAISLEATLQTPKLVFLMALVAPVVHAQEANPGSAPEKVFRATVNASGIQVVEMIAGGYYFDPNLVIVKVNVPVEMRVRKKAGMIPHDITVDAADAGVHINEDLGSDVKSIKFTFTKTGDYAFYCSQKPPFLKSHRERGMQGRFRVVQ